MSPTEEEIRRNVKFSLINASYDFSQKFDLEKISKQLAYAEYRNDGLSPASCIYWRNPKFKYTIIIWAKGKIQVVGAKSEQFAKDDIVLAVSLLQKVMLKKE